MDEATRDMILTANLMRLFPRAQVPGIMLTFCRMKGHRVVATSPLESPLVADMSKYSSAGRPTHVTLPARR